MFNQLSTFRGEPCEGVWDEDRGTESAKISNSPSANNISSLLQSASKAELTEKELEGRLHVLEAQLHVKSEEEERTRLYHVALSEEKNKLEVIYQQELNCVLSY